MLKSGLEQCGLLAATVAALLLANPGSSFAATIIVRDGESIQAAVDAAQPGDTIIVKAGTYTGTATIVVGRRWKLAFGWLWNANTVFGTTPFVLSGLPRPARLPPPLRSSP